MTTEELWQAVLAQIQLNISPIHFTTWFKNTGISEKKDNQIIVFTPNSFVKEWIEQKHNKTILKILHTLDETIKDVKYIIKQKEEVPIKKEKFIINLNINQPELPVFKLNKETNLNPKYTFENFIVSSFNELPHAAAQAVIKNPGFVYNPLFIYGGVGLGKTHLLQAIGNEIFNNFSDKKVKYVPSEKFTSEVINAIRNKEMENLKIKYQQTDVLIIDDIQFLAGKEKTQEEFFHVFNTLYDKNKQIIISSDRAPNIIPSLTERLRSRLEGGMIADISLPDTETLIAILKIKSKEKMVEFSDEILYYIASNIKKNIRELEGVLNYLIAYQKLNKIIIDIELLKNLLKKIVVSIPKTTSFKKIVQVVTQFYDIKEKEVLLNCRRKEIVFPRQIIMYLLRNELKYSYLNIGKKFKNMDHTTVIYSCKKISNELEKNEKLKNDIDLIKQQIYNI